MADPITLAHIIERLETRQVGRGYRAPCPAHRGDNPSALVINEGEDGKVLLYCHAHNCSYEDILRALGLWDASATSSTSRRTAYTKPPKAAKLTEDEKIIGVTACREAIGLLCGPLPDHPNDPELIPPYGAFLEDLWTAYSETGSHEGVQAAYIAMRPALAEAMPKLLRALDQRLKDRMGQPLPSLKPEAPAAPTAKPLVVHAEDVTERPMRWLWYPYIPRDMLVMLDGDPGLGKSMMLLQVATNLSRGLPFLDQFGKPTLAADVDGPQTTLILSAEESLEYIMVPRLSRAGADLSRIRFLPGWLDAKGEEQSFTLDHLPILTQALDEVRPTLVILDPLVAYLGDIDMHRGNQTRPVMARLRGVAERYGCTIIGVRHPSKLDQGGPLMYRGQGNIDIIGAARSGLWVQKHPEHPETQSLMLHSKTNIGMHGRTVIFSREGGQFSWVGVSRLRESMLSGKGPDPYAFLEAFFWLEETMKPGFRYESSKLEKSAESRDISHKVFMRARKALGITTKQLGNRWYCAIPPLAMIGDTGDTGDTDELGESGESDVSLESTTRDTGYTGDTGSTGDTGYSEPISITYGSHVAEFPIDPVDPDNPEYPVSPVIIRAREKSGDRCACGSRDLSEMNGRLICMACLKAGRSVRERGA